MRPLALLMAAWVLLAWALPDALALDEPTKATGPDVLLTCDFEDDEWWRAWGEKKAPQNTERVEGDEARGGKGKSLRVTVRRGDHYGTSFAYRFRDRIGSEPEEIYFQYDLRFDRDWAKA